MSRSADFLFVVVRFSHLSLFREFTGCHRHCLELFTSISTRTVAAAYFWRISTFLARPRAILAGDVSELDNHRSPLCVVPYSNRQLRLARMGCRVGHFTNLFAECDYPLFDNKVREYMRWVLERVVHQANIHRVEAVLMSCMSSNVDVLPRVLRLQHHLNHGGDDGQYPTRDPHLSHKHSNFVINGPHSTQQRYFLPRWLSYWWEVSFQCLRVNCPFNFYNYSDLADFRDSAFLGISIDMDRLVHRRLWSGRVHLRAGPSNRLIHTHWRHINGLRRSYSRYWEAKLRCRGKFLCLLCNRIVFLFPFRGCDKLVSVRTLDWLAGRESVQRNVLFYCFVVSLLKWNY